MIKLLMSPTVESIKCGPIVLNWEPADAQFDDLAMRDQVHADEWKEAQTTKSPIRRTEFLRARRLVRQLTGSVGPLRRSAAGEPLWPEGIRGSIAHKDGHIVVALTDEPAILGIGIDLEKPSRMRFHLEERICTTGDSLLVDRLVAESGKDRLFWLTLVFGLKEAIFKCFFPVLQRSFFFHDAEVEAIDWKMERLGAQLNPRIVVGTRFSPAVAGFFAERSHRDETLLFVTAIASEA